MDIIGNITSYGGLLIAVVLLIDKFRNGTTATQKEIRDTYKERADQLEGIVDELKKQISQLTSDIAGFKSQNELMTKLIANRNPDLERILTEISHFLKDLSKKVDVALSVTVENKNIAAENKDYLEEAKRRHDEIDKEFGPQLIREVKARQENTDRSRRNEERNIKIDRDTESGQGQVLRKK